jgi:hypothetical protein
MKTSAMQVLNHAPAQQSTAARTPRQKSLKKTAQIQAQKQYMVSRRQHGYRYKSSTRSQEDSTDIGTKAVQGLKKTA